MTINMHAHMWDEDVDERVAHYRHERVSRTVMFSNDDKVEEAMRKYPDLVIGFGEVRYGVPFTRDTIRRFVDRGFRGVKVISVRRAIDDPSLFEMYEAIAEANLAIVFHTGHLSGKRGTGRKQMEYESVLFMRPGRLDTLARMFPDMPMVGAHLGAPWCEEACSVMSKFSNVYFDLSGGTVKHFALSRFRALFTCGAGGGFLRDPGEELHLDKLNQLVFGTDNPAPDSMLEFYDNFCRLLDVPSETRERIMHGNAAKILGLDVGETG